jgi:dihydroorotate dehydrogenase
MGPSTEVLRGFARRLGGTKPLIGVGGVRTAADVLCKLKAGASAVQLYTALVYEGVDLPARLARDLSALLRREGFGSPAEAVGLDL